MFSKIINYFKKELSFKGFGWNCKTFYYLHPVGMFLTLYSYITHHASKMSISVSSNYGKLVLVSLILVGTYSTLIIGEGLFLVYESRQGKNRTLILNSVLFGAGFTLFLLGWHYFSTYSLNYISVIGLYYKIFRSLHQPVVLCSVIGVGALLTILKLYLTYVVYKVSPQGFWMIRKSILITTVLLVFIVISAKVLMQQKANKQAKTQTQRRFHVK